ncbi:TetR/AcrR family transcriptional regulator [Bacillus sp. HMF5848]|uniref:TetR/AcrR family transcriptional regulator n=1 Tax=Bacillus sp. HMF5848 TaxID=2495421 RepID=UPI000F79705F|nr:TetR/AcrR family transcriptional regulator [Bacillus sp. HMF5848]RSK25838.1 TetR/AcrR family transcriptional regulator [Bacillus sp. HMF5848]
MPPKKRFTKEQIVDAAFHIAKIDGLDSISIRKIAEKLGSSIAPIYVNFSDVDELKREVIKKVIVLSHAMIHEENSGDLFRDIGAASLRFAKEYNALFNDLIMKQNEYIHDYNDEIGNDLILLMRKSSDLKGFSDEELRMILSKMKIFQTGLSIMIANNILPSTVDEKESINLLESMAEDVILAAKYRKEKGI